MKCYAKVNLALDVTKKLKNGFHELDMINVCVGLYDTLTMKFAEGNDIIIICDDPNVPLDNRNLIYQVIEKFKKTYALEFTCIVKLIKNIPMGAGLGGGSSDAAGALKLLDEQFKTNMLPIEMANFLKPISSDGPFFVFSKPSRVRKTGENVKTIDSNFKYKVFLLKPISSCSTAEVYGKLDLKQCDHPNINKACDALANGDIDVLAKHSKNSLLRSATNINPDIQKCLDELKEWGFDIVNMTGSGSCCFGIAKNKKIYKTVRKELSTQNYELCDFYKIIK